jgi:hypothetical protein
VRIDLRDVVLRVERDGTSQALEQDAPEGVHVASRIDRFPADLLRRHVVDRPEQVSAPGERRARVHALHEAEVG